jgi:hypothetical protein
MTGLVITSLVGFAAISVDAGYVYSTWNQLQASSQAAALAGAKDIGVGGTPITTATAYSSVSGAQNAISGVTAVMTSGYPALQCFQSGPPCTPNQTPATSANGILVRQTATVPLFFGSIFGVRSMSVSASAVALAAGQAPPPLNVMFIVDATFSMGGSDAVCGLTKIKCAVAGFKILLGELMPCVYSNNNLAASCGAATNHNVANPLDEAGLIQFPGVQSDPTGGSCGALSTVSYAGIKGTTTKKSTSSTTLNVIPNGSGVFNTGSTALVTDESSASSISTGTYIVSSSTTATMSTPNSVATGDSIGVWPPLYQIVPLSSDYRTTDTPGGALNASSDLIGCLNTLASPGGFGTFYADAILIAQQNLVASARANTRNVIILLSDGAANASPSNMVAQGTTSPSSKNQCLQAVANAQNAAKAGTWVYAVAYGASSIGSGDCNTDTGSYVDACYTMSKIANLPGATVGTFVNDPTKFYSDNANGCKSASNPNITSLNSVFQNIVYSLTKPRLLPNACVVPSPAVPPSWC